MELENKQISNIFISTAKKNLLISKFMVNIKKLLSILTNENNSIKDVLFKDEKIEILKISLTEYEDSIFIIVKNLENFFELFSKINLKKKLELNLMFIYKSKREKQIIINKNYSRKIQFSKTYHIYLSLLKDEKILISQMKIFFNKKGKNPIFKIRKIKTHKDKFLLSKKRKLLIQKEEENSELNNNNRLNDIINNYSKSNLNEYSLINITKIVFEYILKNQNNFNELTSQKITCNIVKSLPNQENNQTKSFKNIQRRVYDAINVMVASKILKKTKNKRYILNNYKFEKKNNQINFDSDQHKGENLENKILKLEDIIQKKREKLFSLVTNFSLIEKYIDLNKNNIHRINTNDKIEFPFQLLTNIRELNENKFYIKSNPQRNKYLFSSDYPINLISYEEIKKKLSFENNENTCLKRIKKNIKNEEIIEYLKKNDYYNIYYKGLIKNNQSIKKENHDLYEINKIFDLNFLKYDEEYFKNDTLSTNILTENQNFKNTEEYFINSNI